MRAPVFSKLVGIIGLVSLCLAPVASAQGKSLYVLYSGINANFLSLWLAKEAGYFANEGMDVTAVHVRGAAPVVQNLLAGQSQIGMIGATVVATVDQPPQLRRVLDFVLRFSKNDAEHPFFFAQRFENVTVVRLQLVAVALEQAPRRESVQNTITDAPHLKCGSYWTQWVTSDNTRKTYSNG